MKRKTKSALNFGLKEGLLYCSFLYSYTHLSNSKISAVLIIFKLTEALFPKYLAHPVDTDKAKRPNAEYNPRKLLPKCLLNPKYLVHSEDYAS